MGLVLFFVEESRGVRVEVFLGGAVHEHRDEEAEESNEGEEESHDLPDGVILSVADNLSGLVGSNISAEVPHHQGPEAPGDEVLDGEGPPSNEEVVPPLVLLGSVLVVTLSDLKGKIVGSIEEDLLAPSLSTETGGSHDERNNPGNNHDDPEDEDSVGLEVKGSSSFSSLHDENGNRSHDESHEPEDTSDDHGGSFTLVSEDSFGLEEPGSSDTLSNTQDEHEVNRDVTIGDIEEGETPRRAEEERSAPSEHADNQGSELSGDHLATFSVIDHSGNGFDQREGGVNSESEQSQTKNEGPEVRAGEGLSSGGVGSEGESSGTVVLSDGGSNPLEVSDNREYRETGKEG